MYLQVKKVQLIIYLTISLPVLSFEKNSFQIQNITVKDGLSQNTVRCMALDSHGFMWIATLNGLNRYDGTDFTVLMPEYGNEVSLSDNRIRTIKEDKYGYIWLQTNIYNICCYDTRLERFVNYHSFSTNHIRISFARSGDVWLWGNTSGCLQVIHKENKLATQYFGEEQLESKAVNFLFDGSDSVIWIGTNDKLFSLQDGNLTIRAEGYNFHSATGSGNYIYNFTNDKKVLIVDKRTKKTIKEVHLVLGKEVAKLNDIALISPNLILITTNAKTYIFNTRTLITTEANPFFNGKTLKNAYTYFDNRNNLWIYNKSGSIWQFDISTLIFNEIPLIPPSILSFIDLERYSIYHDSRNIIWITTYGNGLFALDQNNGTITHFNNDKDHAVGLRTNFLLSITEDNSGEIWVGTEYAGISKISVTPVNNEIFYPEKEDAGNGNNVIRLIHEDDEENIWLGTKNGNLYVFNKDLKKLAKNDINGGMPYALAEDDEGNMWVGTKGKGLLIFNHGDYNNFATYRIPSDEYSTQSYNNLYAICKDSKGRMWLSTFGDGLFLAQKKGNNLTFKGFHKMTALHSRMRTIIQDKSGLIWIGGNNGIVVFNPDELIKDETQFVSFHFDRKDIQSINNNEVKTIYEDSHGSVWIGTSGGGLNLAMKNENIEKTWFKHYTSEDGLINNIVQGIQEDEEGNLWISTENGISKFNIETSRFENYNFSDNWRANLFCESASCKRRNGEILFGSYNGMYIIKQGDMAVKSYSLPIVITRIKINGINVSPGDKDSPLKEAAYMTKKIRLRYKQNSFNIQFAILNYRNPSANSFTYFLDGYEKTWNPVTRHNVATYRNIPPGRYMFRVKGCNSLGVWNKNETTLEITVVPPFWRTPLAFLIYSILLILSGLITINTIVKINKLNTAVKVEQQLTEFKLRFFTNISHEFRSPLTIIQGTIEKLISLENMPVKGVKQINLLEKSSIRLLRLINQLLAFRQLQNDKMDLTIEQTEIVSFCKDIFSTFDELAGKKKITYSFRANHEYWNMPLDKDKMDKVVFNLLSNAFKFTPEKGKIDFEITIDQEKNRLVLTISDSGIGVPKDKQALLFVRFKQINPSSTGTGIGLHLTSELVKIHKGTIVYKESALGGASFVVEIPLSEQSYEDKEITIVDQEKKNPEFELMEIKESDFLKEKDLKSLKNHRLLVIEDDPEINEFLYLQLNEYFQVSTAQNGKTGLKKCIAEQPDLVICDVMMPEMNGYEVTRRLKSEFRTCHIPVIMLTAYASINHQIQGIESGADSYITKPFSTKYLITRIIKLIEQREKLWQKNVKEPGLIQTPVYTVDRDNEFIKKIHETVEKNIENTEFNIDTFASSVAMGRTVFYQKVKGLTGYTPNEYVRIIRMKKAAELLTTTNLNVSEVAYKVGINNPFYFSKCFKQQFGRTPSEFAKYGTNNEKTENLSNE